MSEIDKYEHEREVRRKNAWFNFWLIVGMVVTILVLAELSAKPEWFCQAWAP